MPDNQSDDTNAAHGKGHSLVPYESTLKELVRRIKDEPFLFVVAVGILLLALTIPTARTLDPRFVVVVLALLSFTAIIGYYVRAAWQHKQLSLATSPSSATTIDLPAKSRRFWDSFAKETVQVVVGRFREFLKFEPTGLMGVGDAVGITELRSFLAALRLSDFNVAYADRMDGDSLKTNLIVIGGPDVNSISKEVLRKISTTLKFGDPSRPTPYEIGIYDTRDGKIYAPKARPGDSDMDVDYALILKAANPFAPGKRLLLIAGSFGYGTWSGIRFVMSKHFLENPLVLKDAAVECLIEVDIVGDAPQQARLVAIRPLISSSARTQRRTR